MFRRNLESANIESLLNTKLFREKLNHDIIKGVVFPAIRNNYLDFYHKGGGLFSFDKDFSTHKKYAAVFKSKNDYISESELKQIEPIEDFSDGYEQIKQNCSLYSGIEAKGVSQIYHKFSFTQKNSEVVVLDIEISFKSKTEEKTQDRIDILLFNKKEQKLRFYEAKNFTNKEIWSTENKRPEVVFQIQRYEKQIKEECSCILSQYRNYIRILNKLFGCDLPEPKDIDEKVTLLVFGFDKDQQQGRMKSLLLNDGSLTGIQYYFVGNISKVKIENMWRAIKCG